MGTNTETDITNEHNLVKNVSWQEEDQLAIYKRGRRVELGSTEKQLHLSGPRGLEPTSSRFQIRRPNHLSTLTPVTVTRPF